MLRNVTDLDLRLSRISACMVKYGDFTATQAELNMSQPNISIHIASLEKRLGYRLCGCDKGGFRLIVKSHRVLETLQTIFDAIGLFHDQAQALSGYLIGGLYLGLAGNLAILLQARFDDALARFQRRDQGVQLNLLVNPLTELELVVIEGELNLAISYFSCSRPSLEYRPLHREKVGAFCSDRHPLLAETQPTLERIAACGWVMHGFLPENLVSLLRPSRSRATTYHMEAVVHAVLAGTHLDYLPIHYTEAWIERGRMYALLSERLSHPMEHSMIVCAGRSLSKVARVFTDDLLQAHGLGA